MSWTAPVTFVSNTVLTAAQMNTYLRDNLNETAPATATTPGYHFVTSGPNTIAERPIVGDWIATAQTTTSTDFTDLTTVGPQITCTTGTQCIYFMSSRISNSSSSTESSRVSIEISGATDKAADNSRELTVAGITNGQQFKVGQMTFEDGLTAGSNTFTMKYRVTGGTGTFAERHLVIISL